MKPYENISKNPYVERPHTDGVQRLYRFENGWGASVVSQAGGLWELTWIMWAGDGPDDYKIVTHMYVQSKMTDAEVDLALGAISACAPVKRTS